MQVSLDRLGSFYFGGADEPRPVDVAAKDSLRNEGRDIPLSIDSVIQSIVESEFQKGREESQAAKVFGLVMDADSGEILA